jgi:hypothetical protein
MAHIWFRNDEDIWSAMTLDRHAVDISVHPPQAMAEGFQMGEDSLVVVIRSAAGDSPVWVLLAGAKSDVRINGFAPVARVHVLQDRDEIRVQSLDPIFFSTETLARTGEFTATERAVFCGRCRQPIQNGEMAVNCPKCGIWYHQTEQLLCFTYSPQCNFCDQSTSLDAGFNWIPEV